MPRRTAAPRRAGDQCDLRRRARQDSGRDRRRCARGHRGRGAETPRARRPRRGGLVIAALRQQVRYSRSIRGITTERVERSQRVPLRRRAEPGAQSRRPAAAVACRRPAPRRCARAARFRRADDVAACRPCSSRRSARRARWLRCRTRLSDSGPRDGNTSSDACASQPWPPRLIDPADAVGCRVVERAASRAIACTIGSVAGDDQRPVELGALDDADETVVPLFGASLPR